MRRAICLLLVFWTPAAWGQSLDLVEAARLALTHAPALAAAEAGRDAAQEDIALARAELLPFVQGTGEFSHLEQKYKYTRNINFLASDVTFNRLQLGVDLVQPLFRLDRWAALAQGNLSAEIGELSLSLARQGLYLEVATAYADVLVAEAALAAAKAQEEAVGRLRDQAQAAFEVGTATVNDVLEAQSRLDLVRSDYIQADNALATAHARLASLTGEEVRTLAGFRPDFAAELPPPNDAAHWGDAASRKAIAVKLGEKRLEVAKQEVRRSFGVALPSLDAVAGLDREKTTNNIFGTGSTVRTERLGLQLTVPLFAGGGTRAQIRKARKLQVQAEHDLEEERRQAALKAREAYLNVKAAAAQAKALSQATVSATKARDAAKLGYEVGLRTIVEHLDAEDRLAASRRDLARAKAAYLVARLNLAANVGELGEAQLDQANRWLAVPQVSGE